MNMYKKTVLAWVLFQCDDHRVSRQHGVIEVTEDVVVLKSVST